MNKSIKTLACVIGCLTAFCGASAYAECVQSEDETVIVRGDLGVGNANKMISLDVYKGKDSDGSLLLDMDENDYLSFIVCHDQTRTDESGKYSFTFDIDNSSGYYVAQTALEQENEVMRESFYYVNIKDFEKARNELNAAKTTDEVLKCITEKGSELGFVSDEYDLISDKKAVAEIIFAMIKNEKISDRNTGIAIFKKAVLVQELNENRIENIFDYAEAAGFENSDISDFYNEKFVTDNLQKDMTKRLSGKAYGTYDEYFDTMYESFILAVVRYPNGYENMKAVVKNFASKIKIPLSDITDSAAKTIAGEDIKSIDDLRSRFAEANKKSSGGNNSGSGSSGGGGGGGIAKGGVYIDADTESVNNNTTIEPDIFTDINDVPWAKDAIIGLAERKIASGDGNGKFMPNNSLLREEFVKFIVSAFEMESDDTSTVEKRFDDVSENDWFCPYIYSAVKNGIINGVSDRNFGIGQSITREDLAVIAYRALKSQNEDIGMTSGDNETFADDGDISEYAKEAVYALKSRKIINGTGNGMFSPKATATRAEAAKIIYLLINE